ncbi:hypothetical protein HK100_010493 [Physocladia obscura]|uniref:WAPL domain-containing protein n=1 Tax=Physocladia obscura TaxID=109957 RepID=A0AAD5T2Y7_9FUNG|nr:hypothetical protein HK100_010493 [Physocladia obscura]
MQKTRVVVTYKRRTGKEGTVATVVSASTLLQSPPLKSRKAVVLVPMLTLETTTATTTGNTDATSPVPKSSLTLRSLRLAETETDAQTASLVPVKRKSDPATSVGESDLSKKKLAKTELLKPSVPLPISASPNKTRRIARMKVSVTGAITTAKLKDHDKSRESQLASTSDISKVVVSATPARASATSTTSTGRSELFRTISPSHLSVSSFERLAAEAKMKNLNVTNTAASIAPKMSTVTYAKSRSYLQALETEEDENRASILNSQIDEGLDSSDDDEEKKKELRNVHELRESGKAARFTDEVEYIISGLAADNSIGMRRSSYFELAGKVLDESFLLKARAHNVLSRFCECVDDSDQIITSISLFIICIMCKNRRNIDILVEHEKIVPFVVADVKKFIVSSNIIVEQDISNFNLGILCMDALFTSAAATKSIHFELLHSHRLSSLIFSKVPLASCCKDSTPTSAVEALPPPCSKQIRQIRANLRLFSTIFLSASKERRLELFNNSELLKTILGILAFYYASLSTLRKPKISVVELVFLVLQLLVDISAEEEAACIALNHFGAHNLICRIVLHAWQFSANVIKTINKGKKQQLVENDIFPLSAPNGSIPFLQEYNGLLLSSLALVTNLVRNDKSLTLNFAIVIMCALIGCLVDDCPVNAALVHVVTDSVLSFAEMADLLQLFAEFHRNSQTDEQKSADDDEGVNNDGVSEAVDGIVGDSVSTADAAGILKQVDRLLYIAKVLRN